MIKNLVNNQSRLFWVLHLGGWLLWGLFAKYTYTVVTLEEVPPHYLLYALTISAIGAVFAGDLITLFVFWELLALTSVFLIWARRTDEALAAAAGRIGVDLREGVYAGLPGPSYETAAEIRMLDRAGAQAVGMSTVLEACAGAANGLRVGAVSCITNPAAGIAVAPLDHDEVVEAGRQIAGDFARLLGAAIPALGAL